MATLFSLPKAFAVQSSGIPYGAAKLYFFIAGTTTAATVYQDIGLVTPHAQPVTASDQGTFPSIYLDPDSTTNYRIQLKTAGGALIYDQDDIPATNVTTAQIVAALTPLSSAELSAGYTVLNSNRSYPYGDVRRSGALLDGTTDDTAALTRWASLGGDLSFPVAATAKVTAAIPLVSNTTIRAVQGATIRQYTTNANVLSATTKTNIVLQGLTLYAVGSMSSTFNGQGFFATGCTDVIVEDCTIKNHRGFGVMFYNSQRCIARYNFALNSPVANSDNHTQVGGDFAIEGGSSDCKLLFNYAVSGNGVGCQIQSITAADVCSRNIIHGNTIQDCKLYGVNVYQLNSGDTVQDLIVSDNVITNITGAVAHSTDGYVYGAGIYGVGANRLRIAGNRVNRTHQAAVVFVDQLAPGGIGVTGCGVVDIVDNTINSAAMYGITVRDPGTPQYTQSKTLVSGNTVLNSTKVAIQVKEKSQIRVCNNDISSSSESGIDVSNSVTKRDRVFIDSNDIYNVAGSGILMAYAKNSRISGNSINTASVHGINVQNADDILIGDNLVKDHLTYGIYVDTTVTRPVIKGNKIRGNGTTTTNGYGYFSRGSFDLDRDVSGCTASYAGDYSPLQVSTPASGTWVAGDTVYYIGPSSGGNIGAVCTAGGSPGTWKTFGVIA